MKTPVNSFKYISIQRAKSQIPIYRYHRNLKISDKFHQQMASNLNPEFAYTVVYVEDVTKAVEFYSKAFGCNIRRVDHSRRWGELESGQTTIAFTPIHQHETDDLTGHVKTPHPGVERQPVELCFDYTDVDAAFKRAVESGAEAVSQPEDKEWGQKVGYVRDLNGFVVRMGSFVHPSKAHQS